MQFEYDPERLIEEVKKRPGIWDYEDAEYRAKNMRYRLWAEVVQELMQCDVKVSKSEMRELEIQLQKKWKSIRDCFQKYVTNPNRTKKPYIYTKQLQFLLKDQQLPRKYAPRPPNPDLSSDSADDQINRRRNQVWRKKQTFKLSRDDKDESSEEDASAFVETQEDSVDYSNDGLEPQPGKMPKLTHRLTPQSQDEFVFANVVDQPVKTEVEDPDKLFLLSLLPHFKTIPEEYRLNAKMELLQVLQRANYTPIETKLL